jgi:hypothetical protein
LTAIRVLRLSLGIWEKGKSGSQHAVDGKSLLMLSSIPFNLWRADHWYNKPVKSKNRPSKQDYTYYMTHNVSVTTSGNYSTKALKYCIDVLGEERCMYSIGKSC